MHRHLWPSVEVGYSCFVSWILGKNGTIIPTAVHPIHDSQESVVPCLSCLYKDSRSFRWRGAEVRRQLPPGPCRSIPRMAGTMDQTIRGSGKSRGPLGDTDYDHVRSCAMRIFHSGYLPFLYAYVAPPFHVSTCKSCCCPCTHTKKVISDTICARPCPCRLSQPCLRRGSSRWRRPRPRGPAGRA